MSQGPRAWARGTPPPPAAAGAEPRGLQQLPPVPRTRHSLGRKQKKRADLTEGRTLCSWEPLTFKDTRDPSGIDGDRSLDLSSEERLYMQRMK